MVAAVVAATGWKPSVDCAFCMYIRKGVGRDGPYACCIKNVRLAQLRTELPVEKGGAVLSTSQNGRITHTQLQT